MDRSDLPDLSGILVIDKPAGWTSHDVVARVRRLTRMKRVGHGGTLDPFATGVLPVAVGSATRMLQYIQASHKGYEAHVVLGAETDSGDVDGAVIARSASNEWPLYERVLGAVGEFVGTIHQVPPTLSAIKVAGVPLHRRVRAGEDVTAPTRSVTVHDIQIVAYDPPDLDLAISCGSGTYIRAIARDLGRALGCFAYCHALRRTNTGPFCLGDSFRLDELEQPDVRERWAMLAQHSDLAVGDMPATILGEDAAIRWYHGRSQEIQHVAEDSEIGQVRVYDPTGRFAGIGILGRGGELLPRLVVPLIDGTAGL